MMFVINLMKLILVLLVCIDLCQMFYLKLFDLIHIYIFMQYNNLQK